VEYDQSCVQTDKYLVQTDIVLGSIDRLNALLTPYGFVSDLTVPVGERANLLSGALLVAGGIQNKP